MTLLAVLGQLCEAKAQEKAGTIYFDLAAGPVTIQSDGSKYVYKGYIYQQNGASIKTITGTHNDGNYWYHVYQSSTDPQSPGYYPNTGLEGTSGTVRVPTYPAVMSPDGTETWAEYITNNKDSRDVIGQWGYINGYESVTHPVTKESAGYRTGTNNRIRFTSNENVGQLSVHLTLDNVWCCDSVTNASTAPLYLQKGGSAKTTLVLYLKGDNFLHRVMFDTQGANDFFSITSSDGNDSTNGSLTVTPPRETPMSSANSNCAITSVQAKGTTHIFKIRGGTIYAATPLYYRNDAYSWAYSCVGGGDNTNVNMEMSGGRLTAVAHCTGSAIGGGGGFSGVGGDGNVTISGGEVYAYQYGVTSNHVGYTYPVTSTAIGGGSSFQTVANSGHVTIEGDAYVYAESVGGVAIGGGSSGGNKGGEGVVTIRSKNSKSPTVIAKSVPGTIREYYTGAEYDVTAGIAIGGGNGGDEHYQLEDDVTHADGGDATVTISSGTVYSASIGGGKNGVDTGGNPRLVGYADINISGGDIQGQFIMAAGASTTPSFTMTGGHINNAGLLTTGGYYRYMENGGAVYMTDGTCSMSGGTIENSSAPNGGAIYLLAGTCTVSGTALIQKCSATDKGGAAYMGGGTFNMNGGTIGGTSIENEDGNTAGTYGGALFMAGGLFNMYGGAIQYNKATSNDGGGVYIASGGQAKLYAGTLQGNLATNGNGGGIYVNPGSGITTDIGVAGVTGYGSPSLLQNQAKNGAGVYLASGSVGVRYGAIEGNIASENGGGLFAQGANTEVHIGWNCHFTSNQAKNGGAVYADAKKLLLSSADIGRSDLGNTATQDGGAFYVTGDVQVNKNYLAAKIQYNSAGRNGGGMYVGAGNVLLEGGYFYANRAENGLGGGLYVGGGSITTNNDAVTDGLEGANPKFRACSNIAQKGGFLYMEGGSLTMEAGLIGGSHANRNKASQSGGGIYADGGTIDLQNLQSTNGGVSYNTAGLSGGGIYVTSTGELNMTGNVTISKNHVPANNDGGGVYLAGVVKIGAAGKKTILVQDNFAYSTVDYDPTSYTPTNATRNNVYLEKPKVDASHKSVITVIEEGLTTSTRVGFSVPRNYVPVIYCAHSSTSGAYLKSFLEDPGSKTGAMYGTVFDDTGRYITVYGTSSPYHEDYVFLSGGSWVEKITTSALAGAGFVVNGSTVTVSTPEALGYVISYVNGLNDVSETHTDITIKLDADIDIGAYGWVPIAGRNKNNDADLTFMGTFDGQGHTITNLYGQLLPTLSGDGQGLFGNVGSSAVIKDVYLQDAILTTGSATSDTYYLGGIAKKMSGGTVSGCVVGVEIETEHYSSYEGGLVGQQSGGAIHSSAAMAEMTGYTMGGLVGQLTGGNLYNSFANPKFNYSGPYETTSPASSTDYYVGGLVAENRGTIANCYVRLERAQSLGSALFGMLAGSNTYTVGGTPANGTISYCYAPNGTSTQFNHSYTYLYNGVTTGLSNYDLYKKVDAPYLYNRPNDNLVGSTGKVLYKLLNEWVSSQINTIADLAYWKRSTAGGYSYTYNETTYTGGNINDDYPIHKMKGMSCAASPDGLSIEYKKSLDDMIDKYNGLSGGGTIWLYASPKEDDGSDEKVSETNDSDVLLYIDEDASLLQSTSAKGTLTAYASQTIPGDPRSWHFLSSSLTNSGIGFNYGQDAAFNWEPNPCHVTISENNDASLFPSDLPLSGSYADVSKIDLYAFYEPEYHWINLKRNSNSHWHMNAITMPITYPNETTLTPGKGYLVSIDQDQLLQNKGTLNNDDEVEVTLGYTPANAWAGLLGYNLIGNPYQSYLDFTAFANLPANAGLWYDDSKGKAVEPTYAVYDAAMGGYVQYKAGASRGSRTASGTLNMHQGFMVRSSGATRAKFTNTMRTNDKGDASFRASQPAFPLINLTVTDSEGVNDFAVLELGRDADEGAEKLRANDSKGWLYLHHGSENYGILFRTEVEDYQPLWFEAEEAGTYTLSWETANAEFEALMLVDNITGVTTNMLTHDSYTFEANPDQYSSRFKIVIGDYKDIDENEAPEPVEGPTFASQLGDEIVLNGEGRLEIMDMTGRIIISRDAARHVSTNGMVPGVYILRLTDKNGTRTQKMVIE